MTESAPDNVFDLELARAHAENTRTINWLRTLPSEDLAVHADLYRNAIDLSRLRICMIEDILADRDTPQDAA